MAGRPDFAIELFVGERVDVVQTRHFRAAVIVCVPFQGLEVQL